LNPDAIALQNKLSYFFGFDASIYLLPFVFAEFALYVCVFAVKALLERTTRLNGSIRKGIIAVLPRLNQLLLRFAETYPSHCLGIALYPLPVGFSRAFKS
jgi:hypothetical protein